MHLVLVRHAESVWNASGRWQGQSDVPLSPRGRLQVRAVARRLFGVPFDARYTSDLIRAAETAAAIGEGAVPEPQFREIDVGEWAGLARDEVADAFPEQVAALRAGKPVRIGGGESMQEFEARVDAAVDALVERYPGQRVLVVTHGGVVRALTTQVLGVRDRHSPLVGVGNTSASVLRIGDTGLELVRYNDALHLDPSDQDSAMVRMPDLTARVALVACAGIESDRTLADGVLAALGIAQYYATASVSGGPLADALLADPLDGDDLTSAVRQLRGDYEMGAFGVVASPAQVQEAVVALLELGHPERLTVPAHGAVAQLRSSEAGATMHSYGVVIDETDPFADME